MPVHAPRSALRTHDVTNQPPPFEDVNLYTLDRPLQEAVSRSAAGQLVTNFAELGARCGSAEVFEWGFLANQNPPQLKTFDRYGQRIDEVEFHPAYHDLMRLGVEAGFSSIAWTEPAGGHTAHAVVLYLVGQPEQSICCPLTMTYAAVPALRLQPELAAEWEPRITASRYDPACRPAIDKVGVTVGMAMTEKQGGSDVRANTTRAVPIGRGGPGADYLLTGHKWFCSAPMCDAFLTLAQAPGGLSCFLVPRWKPDGERNVFLIQRLKNKLGDRANASSEIEYDGTYARLIGEEGRGVRNIIEMVHHTRLDTIVAPALIMRQALTQAIWHASHRSAFQRKLIDQPLMRRVLTDLAIESEAATVLAFRMAASFDAAAAGDEREALLMRLATPIAKYWLNKRVAPLVNEALECLGGAGFIEESILPRLYRQAPLNGIWEGSGNVICLDMLRALARSPGSLDALRSELGAARGGHPALDAHLARLGEAFSSTSTGPAEADARRVVEDLALALQASLLVRHAPASTADAFCALRLAEPHLSFGAYRAAVDEQAILARALPRD
jgi:putative acyl-CoA dehydrogenase